MKLESASGQPERRTGTALPFTDSFLQCKVGLPAAGSSQSAVVSGLRAVVLLCGA